VDGRWEFGLDMRGTRCDIERKAIHTVYSW
jgi:hypothetical protein